MGGAFRSEPAGVEDDVIDHFGLGEPDRIPESLDVVATPALAWSRERQMWPEWFRVVRDTERIESLPDIPRKRSELARLCKDIENDDTRSPMIWKSVHAAEADL